MAGPSLPRFSPRPLQLATPIKIMNIINIKSRLDVVVVVVVVGLTCLKNQFFDCALYIVTRAFW